MLKHIIFLSILLLTSVFSFSQKNILDSIDKVNKLSWIQSEFDIITSLENTKWCYQKSNEFNYTKGKAESELTLGLIALLSGDIEQALTKTIQSNKNDIPDIVRAKIFNQLGRIYIELNELDKAKEYLLKSISINFTLNDSIQIQGNYINYGNLKSIVFEIDSAFFYFDKALKIAKNRNDTVGIVSVFNNIGLLNGELNELEMERIYYLKALKFSKKSSIQKSHLVFNIASSYFFSEKYKEAEKYLKIALHESEVNKSLKGQRNVYKLYSLIEEKNKNYKQALDYNKIFLKYSELLMNENILKKVTKVQLEGEFEQQLLLDSLQKVREFQNIELINKRKTIVQEEKLKKTYIVLILSVVFLVFSIIILSRLYKTNKERKKANDIILNQKKEVEKQRDLVEEINKEIFDSITYAKRLQNAILPTNNDIKKLLPNSFILYKPKDIIAGDFYWVESINHHINSKVNNSVCFAVADCTGHGVPGAMVSVVCANALNRCIKEFELKVPGEILDKTTNLVIEAFEKGDEIIHDGMDIALCLLNIKTRELLYSGANNSLIIISKHNTIQANSLVKSKNINELYLHEIKATKQSVGFNENRQNFNTVSVQLNKGDEIFLYSDGYADQFGGEKNKKFKSSNLKMKLISLYGVNMEMQKELLNDNFEKWKHKYDQVDDVCVLGIKID